MENSDTGALVVTRDYPDSCDIFKDTDIPDTIRGYYPDTGIRGEH